MKGNGCKFDHPKRCSKLMNYGTKAAKGCNLGKNCSKFHPKMCPMSVSKGECFDAHCDLCHVKGTRRKRENPLKVNQKKKQGRPTPLKDQEKKKDDEKKETSGLKSLHQSFLGQISLLKKEIQEAVDVKISSLLKPAVQDLQIGDPRLQPTCTTTQTSPGMSPSRAASHPFVHQQLMSHQLMSHPLAMQNIPIWYHPQNMYQAPVPSVATNMY